MYAHLAMSFFLISNALILASYPGEIAYFNSPNRQLSNGAQVTELY